MGNSNGGVLVSKTNKNDVVLNSPLMLRVSEETPPQIVAPRRPLPMGMASVQFREGPANVSFRGLERSWPSINVLPDERRLPPSQHVIVIISMRRRMVKWAKKLDFSAIAAGFERGEFAFTREDIERERSGPEVDIERALSSRSGCQLFNAFFSIQLIIQLCQNLLIVFILKPNFIGKSNRFKK